MVLVLQLLIGSFFFSFVAFNWFKLQMTWNFNAFIESNLCIVTRANAFAYTSRDTYGLAQVSRVPVARMILEQARCLCDSWNVISIPFVIICDSNEVSMPLMMMMMTSMLTYQILFTTSYECSRAESAIQSARHPTMLLSLIYQISPMHTWVANASPSFLFHFLSICGALPLTLCRCLHPSLHCLANSLPEMFADTERSNLILKWLTRIARAVGSQEIIIVVYSVQNSFPATPYITTISMNGAALENLIQQHPACWLNFMYY